jgi:hypothetical protein
VVTFTLRPLYPPGEKAPGTHWIGGSVGPRAGLNSEGHSLRIFESSALRRIVGHKREEAGEG